MIDKDAYRKLINAFLAFWGGSGLPVVLERHVTAFLGTLQEDEAPTYAVPCPACPEMPDPSHATARQVANAINAGRMPSPMGVSGLVEPTEDQRGIRLRR